MSRIKISFISPIHNEAAVIEKSVRKIYDYCAEHNIEPEMILCENGSTDKTREIMAQMKFPKLIKLYSDKRGLGLAYRQGILHATSDIYYFSGIDYPFGIDDIGRCLKQMNRADIVVASKAHQDSIEKSGLKRKAISIFFRFLMRLLFGLKTRDPQGSVMAKRKKILSILTDCTSDSAFFETQLAIYSERKGYKLIEIPVVYISPRKGSKMSVWKDGKVIIKEILAEYRKLRAKSKSKTI